MRQLLRFAVVGVVNTGLGYAGIFACMYLAGLGPVVSNVMGYSAGLVASYILNRTYTFQSAAKAPAELARFLSIFLLAYLANLGTLLFLVRHIGMHAGGAQVVAGVVYFGLSFVLNKYYVFQAHRTPSKPSTGGS